MAPPRASSPRGLDTFAQLSAASPAAVAVRPLGGVGGGLQPSDRRALGVALPSRALVARGRYFVPGDALCSSNFVGVDYFEASKRATALGATEEWAAKVEARRRADAEEEPYWLCAVQ